MSIKQNILVVEDEQGIRSAMVSALQLKGHHAVGTASQAEAVSAAQETTFDVILTDLRLDGDSGIDIINAIRNLNPNIKPIVMTGYGSFETAVEALRLGAVDYLTKPFKIKNLVDAIEKTSNDHNQEVSAPSMSIPFAMTLEANQQGKEKGMQALTTVCLFSNLGPKTSANILSAFSVGIENSMEHAFDKIECGQVHVSMDRVGNSIIGRVKDSGVGFNAEKALMANTTSHKPSGLSMIQRSADDFEIHSEINEGTEIQFIFTLEENDEGSIHLPATPQGNDWLNTCANINEARGKIRIDCGRLLYITSDSADQLKTAIRNATAQGASVILENNQLPQPFNQLLRLDDGVEQATDEENEKMIKQALWAS